MTRDKLPSRFNSNLPAIRDLGLYTAVLSVITVLFSSCTTLPITGRTQFNVVPESTEIQLGAEAFGQALEGSKISQNQALKDRVRRIGMRLVEASDSGDLDWEFEVIEDDSVINAWALPGGKVAVYTGILNLTEGDDALLATVMGHEIGHVTHHHGAERISQQLGINLIAAGLQTAMAERDPETVGVVMTAFGVGSQYAVSMPFGRHQESESDHVGLIYMARAGYHPKKAIEFWQKMSTASSGGGPPEFLSTHPSYETRLNNLREWQSEALAEYKP